MIAEAGSAALWLAVPLAILMAVLSIGRTRARVTGASRALATIVLLLSLAAIAVDLALSANRERTVELIVASVVAMAAVVRLAAGDRPSARLVLWGRGVAIAGLLITLIGTGAQDRLAVSRHAVLTDGGALAVGGWQVRSGMLGPAAGPGWTALEASLIATRSGRKVALRPQLRTPLGATTETAATASATLWDGRLSARLQPADAVERYGLVLTWQPLAAVASLGEALVALAGLLVLAGSWKRHQIRGEDRW